MAVSQQQKIGIFLIALCNGISFQGSGESFTANHQFIVFSSSLSNGSLNGLAILLPISLQRLFKVNDTVDIIVSKQEESFLIQLCFRIHSIQILHDLVAGFGTAVHGQIEITPVDAHIIAAAPQNLLSTAAHTNAAYAIQFHRFTVSAAFTGQIQYQFFADGHPGHNLMFSAVHALIGKLHVGNRTGCIIQIIRHNGSNKLSGQTNRFIFKYSGGGQGIHIQIYLGDDGQVTLTQKTIYITIHGNSAQHGVGSGGPVDDGFTAVIQSVGLSPHGKIRIHCDQRNRRTSHFHCKYLLRKNLRAKPII